MLLYLEDKEDPPPTDMDEHVDAEDEEVVESPEGLSRLKLLLDVVVVVAASLLFSLL